MAWYQGVVQAAARHAAAVQLQAAWRGGVARAALATWHLDRRGGGGRGGGGGIRM